MDTIGLFEGKEIYRTWHSNRWFFAVNDVVAVLSDSTDVRQYIKKMKGRDNELNVNWGTICTPLDVLTSDGKKRKANCSDTEGILRIIQSIPSKKAEPFKRWLAKTGRERIDEINDPQLAIKRMKLIYEKKGYSKEWIEKRLRGMAVRNDLTDEWKNRGVKRPSNYAILTRDRDSLGFDNLKEDAKDGGAVAGQTRESIESLSGKVVVTEDNYLDDGNLIKKLT